MPTQPELNAALDVALKAYAKRTAQEISAVIKETREGWDDIPMSIAIERAVLIGVVLGGDLAAGLALMAEPSRPLPTSGPRRDRTPTAPIADPATPKTQKP